MKIGDNAPLSEQIYSAGLDHADALAAAQLLEGGKSAYVSQAMLRLGDMPVSKAEREVKGSADYADYIKKMVAARRQANRLGAYRELLRARLTEWQSDQANERHMSKI